LPSQSNASHASGISLLVFEESVAVAEALAELLAGQGFEVVGVATKVNEAVTLLDRRRVDVVVLNVGACHGDSVDVAAHAHKSGRRIVFMMGYGDVEPVPEALSGHVSLDKPIDASDLVAGIFRAVGLPPVLAAT
jgi:DNA-binding NtrC family response regulator